MPSFYILRNATNSIGIYRSEGRDFILKAGEWVKLDKKPDLISVEIQVEERS